MDRIQCFLLSPTATARDTLRRYSRVDEPCGACSYHNAERILGDIEWASVLEGTGLDDISHYDDRWPEHCSCGYTFQSQDPWQHNTTRLYEVTDPISHPLRGLKFLLRDAPVGAMWDGHWYPPQWRGPDGKTLVVKTPGGEWIPDAPSTSGTPWTRTGTPPIVTASPSILFPTFHGFLIDGYLVSC